MAIFMAFDTVFGQCSVAICDDEQVLYQQTLPTDRGQTEVILPMTEAALSATGLSLPAIDCLAFNRGPGAFSGIRINTAVVQALSVAAQLPCVGVSSLAVLADTAQQAASYADGSRIVALIDARQNQLYAGQFIIQDGKINAINEDNNPHGNEYLLDYGEQIAADVIVGDGGELVRADAQRVSIHPTAVDIARQAVGIYQQGGATTAAQALPVYLRDNAWKTLTEQGKV
ncbi:universal bacterial protein YeaZ [Moraxella cuniculi]|uniref:tRNA threonylcarbamoyladenosine biosynthesis protein TsaB n=2 Tax=Moraxella cuniculi TaxID=34061 RepID=A0A448GWD2_9GAMM|nr:universal bacterial protein YeaZ [Moraxella cuniculi]